MNDEPILDKYARQADDMISKIYWEGFEGAIDEAILAIDEVFKENGYLPPKILKDKLLDIKENG